MPTRPPIHRPYGASSDHDRHSTAKRDYDRVWRDFRDHYLRHNAVCVDCKRNRRNTPATEPHHIRKVRDHPELRLDGANLRPICHRCHSVRTLLGQ